LFLEIKEVTGGISSLNEIMATDMWLLVEQSEHFKFTLIEEKRIFLDGKQLIDFEPQVLGESLALYVACRFFQLM